VGVIIRCANGGAIETYVNAFAEAEVISFVH
jgi:hypothetical protein